MLTKSSLSNRSRISGAFRGTSSSEKKKTSGSFSAYTFEDCPWSMVLKAVNSSGSPIHPSIKLAIALRYLAGGSYLDLAFGFNIAYKGIMVYVWEVLEAIDMNMNNINFPFDNEEKLRQLEQGLMNIIIFRWGISRHCSSW